MGLRLAVCVGLDAGGVGKKNAAVKAAACQ